MCPEILAAEEARFEAQIDAAVRARARELVALHMRGEDVAAQVTAGRLALEVMRVSLQVGLGFFLFYWIRLGWVRFDVEM